jgi:threonine/homoserine/homoserine lactone efflux protein
MTFFFSVLMFAIASIITPGPNNIVVFNSVLHKGDKQTYGVILNNHTENSFAIKEFQ